MSSCGGGGCRRSRGSWADPAFRVKDARASTRIGQLNDRARFGCNCKHLVIMVICPRDEAFRGQRILCRAGHRGLRCNQSTGWAIVRAAKSRTVIYPELFTAESAESAEKTEENRLQHVTDGIGGNNIPTVCLKYRWWNSFSCLSLRSRRSPR